MKHLDLFSGIGGFALAASWVWGADHDIHSFVEIEPFCHKVLKKHWPDVPIHEDIRSYKHDGTTIDLLTGGFPCQPFSVAGKQRGEKDDRHLWPEMLQLIREVQPAWIIGENVTGIIHLELDKVLTDLETAGYSCQAFIIPACGVDAPHKRDRVWVVANNNRQRLKEQWNRITNEPKQPCSELHCEAMADTHGLQDESSGRWLPEPDVGRVANGIPNRVDRLKSLGNAIVPQVVVPIMEAIKNSGAFL